MYPVLKPTFRKTGQQFTGYDREGNLTRIDWWSVDWTVIGHATSIEHAKEQGFVAPVLGEAKC